MFAPIRSIAAYRPHSAPGVLAALATTTAIFAATPFLIPVVATQFGIGLGPAGLISTAQVGGFALASYVGGRHLVPGRRILVMAGMLTAFANLVSAFAPGLGALICLRALAGVGMGIATWLGWAQGSRLEHGFAEVAAVGPVVAIIASPIHALLIDRGGFSLVYLALAGLALVSVFVPAHFERQSPVGREVSGSRSNRLLLAAMFLLTFTGSALFVFAAAAGTRTGMSALAVSLAFSLNALTGLVAVRRTSHHPGRWLLVTSLAAFVTGGIGRPSAFLVGMALWGYAFWMAIPAVMRMLTARSLRPDERMGDAQSLMAMGRMLGPAAGGVLLGANRFALLSIWSAGMMSISAGMVEAVERRRQMASTP